jgi:serine/threonine protein phosphatase PrpC
MEGTPVSGTIKRSAGDLLIVGTDGVFDRVDQSFAVDVLRGCIQYKGDLQRAAEQIITELASFRDVGGYVCDDNLTMGLLGHGSAPKLPPGYWVGENGIENEADAVSSVAASARSKDQV